MYRLRVIYPEPADREAFDEHYATKHSALVKEIPGVRNFAAGRCDPIGGEDPQFYLIAELQFDTRESADAALGSPAGQAAVADLANFAPPGVTFHFTPDTIGFGG